MLTTTIFATLHHLLAFTVTALLVAELVLLRPGISQPDRQRLGRIDLAFGALFGALALVGTTRTL